MAKVFQEYFNIVYASDVHNYGYGSEIDFGSVFKIEEQVHWIITNPPFRLAENFISNALSIATSGVAMLTRTTFLESVGRYAALFSKHPPSIVGQFVERVPMVKGRLDKNASTATGYCWLVWGSVPPKSTELRWIPPCRKDLERLDDYDVPKFNGSRSISVLGRKTLV